MSGGCWGCWIPAGNPTVAGLLDDYVGRTPGSRIEEKETALAWHYRQTEETLGNWQALELASLLENTLRGQPVEVMHGAKVIEIRQQGVDQGSGLRSGDQPVRPV